MIITGKNNTLVKTFEKCKNNTNGIASYAEWLCSAVLTTKSGELLFMVNHNTLCIKNANYLAQRQHFIAIATFHMKKWLHHKQHEVLQFIQHNIHTGAPM